MLYKHHAKNEEIGCKCKRLQQFFFLARIPFILLIFSRFHSYLLFLIKKDRNNHLAGCFSRPKTKKSRLKVNRELIYDLIRVYSSNKIGLPFTTKRPLTVAVLEASARPENPGCSPPTDTVNQPGSTTRASLLLIIES